MMEPRTRRILRVISCLAALALLGQLAAMALPEWTVERAPAGWPASQDGLGPGTDPTVTTTGEAEAAPYVAPPPPAMTAHLGLFYVMYRQNAQQQESFYGFCNGISPAFSLEKCLIWRSSQAAALGSGGLAYAALVLLLVAAGGTLKTHAVEYNLSWAWTLFFTGGILNWAAAIAFFLLTLAFRREHAAKKDGYEVEVGYALFAMAGVGSLYILLPFLRMLLHKCRPFAPVGGREPYHEEQLAQEPVAPEQEAEAGVRGEARGKRGRGHQHRPHGGQQHACHHHQHRRRQSRELAETPTAVVVVDAEPHVMDA